MFSFKENLYIFEDEHELNIDELDWGLERFFEMEMDESEPTDTGPDTYSGYW